MVAHPPTESRPDAPTSVYVYYDRSNLMLYVGVTNRATKRQGEHNSDKEWWQFVHHQTVQHFPTRTDALKRERDLIARFRPPFNKQHNPGHDEILAAYYAWRAAGPNGPMDKTIVCKFMGNDGPDGQPMFRSPMPVGNLFAVRDTGKVTARVVGAPIDFSRITYIREKSRFVFLCLLRTIPNPSHVELRVKWDGSKRPIEMVVQSATAYCGRAR